MPAQTAQITHPAVAEETEDLNINTLTVYFNDSGVPVMAETLYMPDRDNKVWIQRAQSAALGQGLPANFLTSLATLAANPASTGADLFELIVEIMARRLPLQ